MEGNTPPECQEFINEVNNFFDSTMKLFLSVPTYMIYRNKQWKYSVNSQRAVKDLAMKFISKRLDEIKEEDKQLLQQATDDEAPVKVDFLTYLVHSGKMSLDAITANVIDLMTAGVDTVCCPTIIMLSTVLNLIQYMEKNFFNFEKRAFFW